MKAPLHPAVALYKRLFDQAVADGAFCNPGWIVERAVFYRKGEEAGIECPQGFIEAADWEETIGLRQFAQRICTAYRRRRGITLTPVERGHNRLLARLDRLERGQ